jgi:heme A synthase
MPMKIFHSFIWDDVSVTALFNVKNWSFIKSFKKTLVEKDFNSALPNSNFYEKLIYILVQILHHLFYYFLLVIIVLSTFKYLKNNYKIREINLILTFSLISILMIIVTVGAPRYKYHIIILLLPLAASYLESKLLRGRKIIAKS